jgi:methionyl-tRNA formyltransferase
MDAGNVLERFATEVGDAETAGEALDRIAVEAVPMMVRVVRRLLAGDAAGEVQDESRVSRAAKLSKADASVHFTDSAERVRLRVNGLQPWPGCSVRVAGQELRLLRVGAGAGRGHAGELLADGSIACGDGSVLPMLVQSPGGKAMEWNVWMRGQRLQAGAVVESSFPAGPVS